MPTSVRDQLRACRADHDALLVYLVATLMEVEGAEVTLDKNTLLEILGTFTLKVEVSPDDTQVTLKAVPLPGASTQRH